MPINSSGAILLADPLEYHDMIDWGTPAILTYGGTNSFYGWSIKSDNGADFSLVSFNFNDWGGWTGDLFTIEAFRNGASLGTVSFTGNTDNSMINLTRPGTLSSIFQTVDEIRVYKQDGTGSWIGINSIKVSSPAIILPVNWLSFTASHEKSGILLNWSTAREQGTKDFVVEHSSDGHSWGRVAIVDAAGSSSDVRNYSYLHRIATSSIQYYRIIQQDINDKESYSRVVSVTLSSGRKRLGVYPNPVASGVVMVRMEKEQTIQLFSADGKLAFEKRVQAGVQAIQLAQLKKGIYIMKAGEESEMIVVQ